MAKKQRGGRSHSSGAVAKARRALEKGGRLVKIEVDHRPGTAAAKAATVFEANRKAYLKGDMKRGEVVKLAAKRAGISEQTASTYFHNHMQGATA